MATHSYGNVVKSGSVSRGYGKMDHRGPRVAHKVVTGGRRQANPSKGMVSRIARAYGERDKGGPDIDGL